MQILRSQLVESPSMSNARKKVKAEKKAKARREKAKRTKIQRIEEKKSEPGDKKSKLKEKSSFRGLGQQASSKPSERTNAAGRRTQGK